MIRWLLVLLCAALGPAALATPATAQTMALEPSAEIDGPSPDIDSLGGLSVARDGSGGLVYLKDVGGIAHAFVARLQGGAFRAPEELDGTLSGGSSQPVIAAGNGGLLLIAFINAGQLYVVDRAGSASAYTPPDPLADGASNPAIAISNFGKAYLAFTALGAGGHDVRTAYYYGGRWELEAAPLDAVPADDAGVGTGRPAVGAAGDGVGIVAWGEAGHVYSRKVWGTFPSTVFEQADVSSLSGWSEVSADDPAIAVGGNSSYADVAYRERISNGGGDSQTRVLLRRLRGSQYERVNGADGLSTPGTDSADDPQIAADEYGQGLATSATADSGAVFSMQLGGSGLPGATMQINSTPGTGSPSPVPAPAGYHDGLIAWQQDPGSAGSPEIRVRFFDGSGFGPELVASSPALGVTQADRGLYAAGDIAADVAIAWVQTTGAGSQIVAAQLYQPPGSIGALARFHYVRQSHTRLTWPAAREPWPPLRYLISVDGRPTAQTRGATGVTLALADGPHTWSVQAVNRGGLTSTTRTAWLWVDTVPPIVSIELPRTVRAGTAVHLFVTDTDAVPPQPAADASGIAKIKVRWGDRTSAVIGHGKYHLYRHPGSYRVTVTVTDRAGNATTVRQRIRIEPRPRPKKPKRRVKHK